MPPVAAALGTAATAVGASLGAAVGAPLAGTGFLASLSAGSVFAQAFTQVAVGVALSAISRALAPTPGRAVAGVKTSVQFGDDAPASIILGRFATAGDLVYANSCGDRNEYHCLVVELSDLPAKLRRVMVNGEWVSLGSSEDPTYGRPVLEYRSEGKDYLWIRFHGGTQTAADAGLVATFHGDDHRPYTNSMVGRGIAYAVIWARFNPKVHNGLPECLFELDGARLYDPRRDSTAGGSGPQRWADQESWSALGDPANDNPIVQIYNLWLGLRDPVTDAPLWGGRGDILQSDLPAASWLAAMNDCDALASGDGGDEAQYRAGLELLLTEDAEPAAAAEELLRACQGQIACVAGQWLIKAGPSASSVWAFSDDDVIVTAPEDFDPFPGLDAVFNGVTATYPEPEDGWQPKDAPKRYRASYRAADGGRLQVAALQFPGVPYRSQVQRLMKSALEDARRFRRHTLVLPPEARALAPLDVVEWTSARNGYQDKQFAIDLVEDLPNGCVAVSLREVDPTDYDFDAGDLLPTSVGFSGRPPRLPWPKSFSVSGVSLPDAEGRNRIPAIKLDWNPGVRASGVRWKVRLADQADAVPQIGGADYGDADLDLYGIEVFDGEPLEVTAGEALVSGWFADVARGTTTITPVLAATAYEVKARYAPDGDWSAWLPVTTPPTYLKADDLDALLNSRIDQAQADADAAAADAAAALEAAAQAAADVATLAGDTVDDLNALIAALGGIDAGDILANRALALAALQTGWNADPTFQAFTGDLPDNWTHAGLTGHAVPFAGTYSGGIAIATPGATTITLRAASDVPGQMPAADPAIEWVVVYAMVTLTAGDPDSIRIRAAWKAGGSSIWTAGHMRGLPNALGTLSQHVIGVKPGVVQGFEVLVQRPIGPDADAVSVFLGIDAAYATPVDLDVHLLGLRAATEVEIAANAAPGALSAAVDTLTVEITGISDSLAALQTSLIGTAPAGTLAHLAATYLTAASTTSAIAAATTSLQAQIDGAAANLALNYYTKAALADALPTLVGGISAELSGRLDTAEAAIAEQAAFRVTADNELAGRVSTIEARRDPGSVVTNGSFVRETRQTWDAAGAPVTTVVDFAGWSNVASTFTTVAKAGTTAPLSTCPTPWCCQIGYSSAARTAENERTEAKEGDYLTAAFQHAVAAGGSATLRLVIRWLDAGGVQIGTAISDGPAVTTSTLWARWTSPHIGPAPAGTAHVRVDLRREGGGTGTAFVTGVEARKADARAVARIVATEAVATSASGAISTLTGLIEAAFGTQAAFVSDTRSAVASVDRLASTWVFRQKAGAAVGTAEAVAFETPDGTALSSFRLGYDLIDLDGRVTARDLNVSSSVNMVPDDQLQDPVGWGLTPGDPNWTHYPISSRAERSLGELRWTGGGGTYEALESVVRIPVNLDSDLGDGAPEKLSVSYRTRGDGAAYRAYLTVKFFDKDGVQVGNESVDDRTVAGGATAARAQVIETPATAAWAVPRLVVKTDETASAYVRFWAPVMRRQTKSVEIADGAVTAEKANFTDLGAVVANLGTCTITSALNFADGVVLTGAVGLNAITDVGAAVRESNLVIASLDTWEDVCSFTVSVAAGAAIILAAQATANRSHRWETNKSFDVAGDTEYRVTRNGSVVFEGFRDVYVDTTSGSGSRIYKLQVRCAKPAAGTYEQAVWNWDTASYSYVTTPYSITTQKTTLRIGYAHLVVQSFKR